jgi:hypothetical protein
MDHEESRQLIQDQIDRWVRKHSNRFYSEIVLRRLVDGRPAETVGTFHLHDPVDDDITPDLQAEGLVYWIAGTALRDATARKRGMQSYALVPIHDTGEHGRRKNFRAVPEEPEPAEAEPVPASGGTP